MKSTSVKYTYSDDCMHTLPDTTNSARSTDGSDFYETLLSQIADNTVYIEGVELTEMWWILMWIIMVNLSFTSSSVVSFVSWKVETKSLMILHMLLLPVEVLIIIWYQMRTWTSIVSLKFFKWQILWNNLTCLSIDP